LRLVFLRYVLVGVMLFLLDYTITHALYLVAEQALYLSQWAGRFCGAAAGYSLHRVFTFQSSVSHHQSVVRYWLLAVCLWAVSPVFLNRILYGLPNMPARFLLAKVLTEILLVGSSYALMRSFVFRKAPSRDRT